MNSAADGMTNTVDFTINEERTIQGRSNPKNFYGLNVEDTIKTGPHNKIEEPTKATTNTFNLKDSAHNPSKFGPKKSQ